MVGEGRVRNGTGTPAAEASLPASMEATQQEGTWGLDHYLRPEVHPVGPAQLLLPAAPPLASVEGGAEGREAATASPWGEPPILSPLSSWGRAKFKVTH